jgi:hypothetical protein
VKYELHAHHYTLGQPETTETKPARRQRKPSVRAMIKQAEAAGKRVSAIQVDGITLRFDAPEQPAPGNEWDEAYGSH